MQANHSDHKFATLADAKAFALAGNAIITLESLRSGSHFTYRIQAPDAEKSEARGFHHDSPVYFVKYLAEGSADEGQWVYLGMIKNSKFFATKASARLQTSPVYKAFAFFFASSELHPELVVRHEGRCGRCGRTLTVPASIDLGIGPECAAKMGINLPPQKLDYHEVGSFGGMERDPEALQAEQEASLASGGESDRWSDGTLIENERRHTNAYRAQYTDSDGPSSFYYPCN